MTGKELSPSLVPNMACLAFNSSTSYTLISVPPGALDGLDQHGLLCLVGKIVGAADSQCLDSSYVWPLQARFPPGATPAHPERHCCSWDHDASVCSGEGKEGDLFYCPCITATGAILTPALGWSRSALLK